jgi:hypothetical protein
MSLIRIHRNPSRGQLLVFAAGWLVCLGTLSVMALSRTGSVLAAGVLGSVAVLVPAIGLFAPGFLRIVYLTLMWATFPIGWLVSHLVLAVVFYLVITPMSLLMRLAKYDPMTRRFDPRAETYWTPRESTDDTDRCFRQF